MSVGPAGGLGVGQRPLALYLLLRMTLGLLLVCSVPFVGGQSRALLVLNPSVLLAVGLSSFALWAVSVLLAPRWGARPAFLWVQFVMDAALATLLLHLSAGPRSGLFVLYLPNIFAAGILLSPTAALLASALDTVFFLGSSLLVATVMPGRLWTLSSFELAYELVLRCFGLLLIGLLVRLLNERVRQVRIEQSAVLDELSSGVLRLDLHGRVLSANPAARRLLGPVEGRRLNEVLTPVDDRWEQAIRLGEQVHHLLCSRSPLETGGEVVLVEDITRLREMEANLEREERLAAVGRLTAALAHEIRNPLAGLSGAVQLLAEERPDPLHDIVLREVRRINGLVEELLDQARPLAISPQMTDPGPILEESILGLQLDPRYRDRINVQIDVAGLSPVFLDPGRFRQVLTNLLLNAAQAIPERGRVSVKATMEQDDLLIQIEDTGVGIAPEAQYRLFDPFFTTRSGGTGLGLSTVHRIVMAHGGQIRVESEVGRGSAFWLRFPAKDRGGERLAG